MASRNSRVVAIRVHIFLLRHTTLRCDVSPSVRLWLCIHVASLKNMYPRPHSAPFQVLGSYVTVLTNSSRL